MADDLQPLLTTEAQRKAIRAMLERRYIGPGVFLSPDGRTLSINPPQRRQHNSEDRTEIFDAKILDVATVNGEIRWMYTIELGYWDMSNPANGGTWVKTSGDDVLYAFSAAEDMNTFTSGTGTIGTGNTDVAQADGVIDGTACSIKPLPVGDYPQVKFRGRSTDGQRYYTIINFPNSNHAA